MPYNSAEHDADDAGTRGAERHSDADFAGAPNHEVGHDAIEADGSENQGEDAEQAGEPRQQPLLREVGGDLVVERAQIDYGEVGIDVGERAAQQVVGIKLGRVEVDDDGVHNHRLSFAADELRLGELREALGDGPQIHRANLAAGIVHFEIVKHAHDFERSGVLGVVNPEVLSDGIFVGVEALDEGLIDERNGLCGRGVLLGEVAAAQHGNADGLEKVSADAIPRGAAGIVGRGNGMTLRDNALTPVVAFEGLYMASDM